MSREHVEGTPSRPPGRGDAGAGSASGEPGPRAGSIRGNTGWALLGTGSVALSQWLIVALLARTTDASELGSYALALAIVTPVLTLTNLGLRTVYISGGEDLPGLRRFFQVRLLSTAGAVAVTLALVGLLQPNAVAITAVVAVGRGADAIGDVLMGHFQAGHRMRPVAGFLTANSIVSVAGLAVVAYAGGGVVGALAASTVSSIVFAVLLPARRLRRGHAFGRDPGPARQAWRVIALTGLPLGLASVLTAVTANVPRYALEFGDSTEALGVFFALSTLLLAPVVVVSAGSQALLPAMSRALRTTGVASFTSLLLKALVLVLLGGVALVGATLLGGPWAVDLLYGPGYGGQQATLLVLAVATAVICGAWMLDTALAAAAAYRRQLLANVLTALVTLAAAWPLVAALGILGAGLLTLVMGLTMCAVRAWLLVRALRRSPWATGGNEQPTEGAWPRSTWGARTHGA